MTDWETKLKQNLLSFKSKIIVPDNLEETLSTAVNQVCQPRRLKPFRLIAAVAIVFLLLLYYSPVLSYQVQKILGYEKIMNKTLASLNDNGYGQVLNKTYTDPQTGISLSLDGAILDSTQLIIFYTIKGTMEYSAQDLNTGPALLPSISYKLFGFWEKTARSQCGHGEYNPKTNEVKWQMSYDPPSAFARTLDFSFQFDYPDQNKTWHQSQLQMLSFTLDHSKAMASTIKQTLNIPLQVGNTKLNLLDIEAAPTQTIIHLAGHDASGPDKAMLIPSDFSQDDLELVVNGKALSLQGGGGGTGNNLGQWQLQYTLNYEAIKTKVENIQLKIKQITLATNTQISTALTPGCRTIANTENNQLVPLNILDVQQNSDSVEVRIHIADEPLACVTDATLSGPQGIISLTNTQEENVTKIQPSDITSDSHCKFEYDQVLEFQGGRLTDLTTLNIIKAKLIYHPNMVIDIPVQ